MKKSYYQQLKPHVLKHIKLFTEDLTVHDRNSLRQYTGEFFYGYRTTGTDLFKVTPLLNAIREVENTGHSTWFSENGLQKIKNGSFNIEKDCYYIAALLYHERDTHFFHGKNGAIKKVSRSQMEKLIADLDYQITSILSRIVERQKSAA